MKTFAILLLLSLAVHGSFGQDVFSNQTNNTLEKVIQQYPNQFRDIRGPLLSSQSGRTEYKSTIGIPGAIATTIVQSTPAHKNLVSWQSLVYSGAGFDQARKRFEELFSQIKNTIVRPESRPVIIDGQYKDPTEEMGSTTINFDLLPATGPMQHLSIELTLKNQSGKWNVVLCVTDKDNKDAGSMAAL
jgi:hypothetical protein